MRNSPIEIFEEWFKEELHLTEVRIPTAVCLSTHGTDEFPNARFVSLKEIINDAFIITGPLNSLKGIEIARDNHVALTFWWTETERQIRVQGIARKISEKLADKYFHERDLNSKIVSSICEQGKETKDRKLLEQEMQQRASSKEMVDRPKNWGGYSIDPVRMEFMEFRETRFHDRKLFELENGKWRGKQIQP
ncbi:pyridoxal 5'-phosphate synthase [Allomuricauda sp. NBRC 101325]|uniref:pyridoxine/pyridoxamine 5'-phosphate oxidase n=1 Tax=Allomuricauda sp. NBRC 101325 TaxID=1113758 RepID=UPI0024A17444|nr:pyridoxal 5'-phosphate synthase [Muricauda sp. NBRC 101325]GLU45370.1 pyridoxine/pyridoxamine 5'-phosphate oxidase [Muricauda sp. NBRC 101325]